MTNKILHCNCELAKTLRRAIPAPGIDYKNLIMVHLKPGETVRQHSHADHTALYYSQDCAPILITPKAGMIIYLPPGTIHAVPETPEQRLSMAMLVDAKEARVSVKIPEVTSL